MSKVTISQNQINNLLSDLGKSYKKFDESISLIRFGSSILTIPKNNADIDILLISNKEYFDYKLNYAIKDLKDSLLGGSELKGFDITQAMIAEITCQTIESQSYINGVSIIPKYIFGPFDYNKRDSVPKIYLHIKGPLTTKQFLFFSREMPYHGLSILQSAMVITGTIDMHLLYSGTKPDSTSLRMFNDGLKKRVDISVDIFDVTKCIKKIILNNNLYFDYNNPDNGIRKQFQIKDIKTKNLYFLKQYFYDIYFNINLELSQV